MKKNYIYNLVISFLIIILGLVFLSFPTYYGIDHLSKIETGNLFFNFALIYALLNLSSYFIDRKNNKNNLVICILSFFVNMVIYVLNLSIHATLVVPVSMMIYLFLFSSYGVIKVANKKLNNNNNYKLEIIYLIILNIFGITLAFNMLTDFVLQTIMLGFFISIVGALDILSYSINYIKKK